MPKKAKSRRDAVTPFRDKLWDIFEKQAKGVDGADVVLALRQAGEEIWAVGIDRAYSTMRLKDQEDVSLGNAFDVTWLTIACVKLNEIKHGHKPKLRAKPSAKPAKTSR